MSECVRLVIWQGLVIGDIGQSEVVDGSMCAQTQNGKCFAPFNRLAFAATIFKTPVPARGVYRQMFTTLEIRLRNININSILRRRCSCFRHLPRCVCQCDSSR